MSSETTLPPGPFGAILADPPWRFRTWNETNQRKSASRYYPLMQMDEIKALPVADVAAKDCVLFLWSVSPMLPHAFAVMEAWGFKFKTVAFVWAKTSKRSTAWAPRYHLGLGYWTRANAEYCLLGTRGAPKRISKGVKQLIVSPLREHSRKPDEVRESIQQLTHGPYLELFARSGAKGWAAWGNEAPCVQEAA